MLDLRMMCDQVQMLELQLTLLFISIQILPDLPFPPGQEASQGAILLLVNSLVIITFQLKHVPVFGIFAFDRAIPVNADVTVVAVGHCCRWRPRYC
jgi:hypothetical protein